GWNIAGTKNNVRSFKREDFVAYRKKHYVAGATTVIVAGQFQEKSIISGIKKRFAGIDSLAKAEKKPVTEKQDKPTVRVRQKKTDQMHLVLGVRAFPVGDKRNPALKLLAAVLGAGMSSRLFVKLREEMGVCYYVRAETDLYTDHGHLAVSAGIDKNRLFEVLEVLLKEFRKFKTEPVPPEELQKAKDYLIGTMYLGLESSDELAEFYGYQELLKKQIKKPDEIAKEIQKVKVEQIREVAEEIFQNNRLNLAVVGEVKEEKKLSSVLGFISEVGRVK
ncbi:MAG: pitrilysin family protein, partial [Candidatus Paceibacterota bacterium]